MWRANFEAALRNFIASTNEPVPPEPRALMDAIQAMYSKQGIWDSVAMQLGITSRQAHNYYHNTWQRQFFEDLGPYKEQLEAQIRERAESGMEKNEAVGAVAASFLAGNEKRIHGPSFRQFLHQAYESVARRLAKQNRKRNDIDEVIRILDMLQLDELVK